MTLETWALIAEMIGSFGVVVTLVILIFEVRDNTAAQRSTNRQSTAARTETIALSIAENPDIARILSNGPNTDSERLRVAGLFVALLRNAEEAYLQYREGGLTEEYFVRRAAAAMVLLNVIPGGWDRWPVSRATFDPEFAQYIESNLMNWDLPFFESTGNKDGI